MNELEKLKKKLIYRSNYRGTKEMDILLSNFVKSHIDLFTESQLNDLDKFLDEEDEIIFNFYYKNIECEESKKNSIFKILKNYKI